MDDLGAGAVFGAIAGIILGGFLMTIVTSIKQTDGMLEVYNKQFCAAPCSPSPSGARLTDGKYECYCTVTVKP